MYEESNDRKFKIECVRDEKCLLSFSLIVVLTFISLVPFRYYNSCNKSFEYNYEDILYSNDFYLLTVNCSKSSYISQETCDGLYVYKNLTYNIIKDITIDIHNSSRSSYFKNPIEVCVTKNNDYFVCDYDYMEKTYECKQISFGVICMIVITCILLSFFTIKCSYKRNDIIF